MSCLRQGALFINYPLFLVLPFWLRSAFVLSSLLRATPAYPLGTLGVRLAVQYTSGR